MAEEVSFRRTSRLEIGATGAAFGAAAGAASGGHGRAVDQRSLPGPTEASLRALDAGSGGRTLDAPVWRPGIGVDDGALPSPLGIHTAEAGAASIREKPEAVRQWLREKYPAIQAQAKRDGAEIHWGDEMSLRSDHQAGRSWGRRGQTPVISGTGGRFGCNMVSSITNRGRLYFMVFKERFNVRVFITTVSRFLKTAQGLRQPVFPAQTDGKTGESPDGTTWLASRP